MTLSRDDLRWYGTEWGLPVTPKQAAQMELLRSRDAERDAPIWHDNGATVAAPANDAGARAWNMRMWTCARSQPSGALWKGATNDSTV